MISLYEFRVATFPGPGSKLVSCERIKLYLGRVPLLSMALSKVESGSLITYFDRRLARDLIAAELKLVVFGSKCCFSNERPEITTLIWPCQVSKVAKTLKLTSLFL